MIQIMYMDQKNFEKNLVRNFLSHMITTTLLFKIRKNMNLTKRKKSILNYKFCPKSYLAWDFYFFYKHIKIYIVIGK